MLSWAEGQILTCEKACGSGGGDQKGVRKKKREDVKGILQLMLNTQLVP